MQTSMPIYIAAAGADIRAASALKAPCVYLVYTVGAGGSLVRSDLPNYATGGILGLSDYNCNNVAEYDPQRLCREIASECSRRGYGGVLLDFENPNSYQFASNLSALLAQKNITHYAPIALANSAPSAKILVSSSISGGSFSEMLQSYCTRFGAGRLALDIVRVCAAFAMPSYDPDGETLSAPDFRNILQNHNPSSFFSKELCAKYFTFHPDGKTTKFVLYDDIASTSAKIETAARQGFCAAFVLYRDFGGACAQLF